MSECRFETREDPPRSGNFVAWCIWHLCAHDNTGIAPSPLPTTAVEWQPGEPPKHGYYLGAWRRGDRLTVSELWFNQDANPRWWFSRGYTGLDERHGQHYAVRSEVVAWMPLPEPPKEERSKDI